MRIAIYSILCSILLATPAIGAEADSEADKNVLGVGLKGGVGLPQLNSSMDTTFQVRLEGVYLLPFLGSRLGLITSVGYSQPEASGSGQDDRLPGGEYTWIMTQRQISWNIGLLGRFMPYGNDWNVGLMAGLHLLFLSTLTDGESGGEPFGEHDEQATLPGVFAGVQGEYVLGPGALFAEVAFSMGFQDLRTTGDVPASAIGILVGYRLLFAL